MVLIGIDSLRIDIVGKQGPAGVAPHMREFLDDSVWFTDTMTPLARTFPSVMSILTGRQPHKTGAYMNLPPRDFIKEGDTLGRVFSRAGYHSVFAMDEVRFANIDTSYGFDQTVTPPAGSTEFLMSLFADTPLSNTVMNSRLGSWLFPFIHANRGAAATYDPDTFVDRFEREVNFGNPLFLATHLTLSHWPYNWAGSPLPGPKTDVVVARLLRERDQAGRSAVRGCHGDPSRTRRTRECHRRAVFGSRRILRQIPRAAGT